MSKSTVNMTEVLTRADECSKRIAKRRCRGIKTINTLFAGLMMAATAVYDEKSEIKERDRLAKRMAWNEEIDTLRTNFVEGLPEYINQRGEEDKLDRLWDELARNSVCDSLMALETILRSFRTVEIDKFLKDTVDSADRKKDSQAEHVIGKPEDEISPRDKILRMEKMVSLDNNVRARLLESVDGQREAVNLFLDTVWENDFRNFSNKNKTGVRGAFTFIGNPFCGMEFLAFEAAKELKSHYYEMDMRGYSSFDSKKRILASEAFKEGNLTSYLSKNRSAIIVIKNLGAANSDVQYMFEEIINTGKTDNLLFGNCIFVFEADIAETELDYAASYIEQHKESAISSLRKYGFSSELLTHKDKLTYYFTIASMGFPASVFAASTPVYFDKSSMNTLEKIAHVSFDSVVDKLQNDFNFEVEVEDKVYAALLYAQKDEFNALNISESVNKFVTGEMKKLFSLYNPETAYSSISNIKKLMFYVDAKNESEEIQRLFIKKGKTGILFVGMYDNISRKLKDEMKDFNLYMAETGDEAISILNKHDIQMVIMRIDSDVHPVKLEDDVDDDIFLDPRQEIPKVEEGGIKEETIQMFDYKPIGSSSLARRRNDLRKIHKKFKEVPIYIDESSFFAIDQELRNALIFEGAKGIIQFEKHYDEIGKFIKKLKDIGRNLYIHNMIDSLKKQSRVLQFETTPLYDKNEKIMYIRLKHFELAQVASDQDQDVDMEAADHISVRFRDVIGADSAKEELKSFVEYLKNPAKYIAGGLKAPKGVLLYGKPGTGKTMLAKAVAAEAGVAFLAVEGSSFIGRYVGDEQRIIKELFAKARRYAPSIVFIDEIDTIGKARTGSDSTMARVEEQALTTLLTEMDGAKTNPKYPVFVIGATNYGVSTSNSAIGILDPALVRRFDRAILVELPNKNGRMKYLKRETADEEIFDVSTENLIQIAERTAGSSLADLSNVIEFAKKKAVNEGTSVTDKKLNDALDEIMHGEKVDWGNEVMERIAYHEAGHAVMAAVNGNTPSYASITSRGNMGGFVTTSGSGFVQTKSRLLQEIDVCLAGRAAEVMKYGAEKGISTGSGEDLRQATEIAKAIICNLGMDDSLFIFSPEDMNNPYYAELIHKKVTAILNTEMEKVTKTMEENEKAVNAVAQALLDNNMLTRYEIENILDDNGVY